MPSISTISSPSRPLPPNGVSVHPPITSRLKGQSSRVGMYGNGVLTRGRGLKSGRYWRSMSNSSSNAPSPSRTMLIPAVYLILPEKPVTRDKKYDAAALS